MTDFNSMPLSEQLKALQAGDWVETDAGARLPCLGGSQTAWVHVEICKGKTDAIHMENIIRVVRPGERKGAEIGQQLAELYEAIIGKYHEGDHKLLTLVSILKNHHERTRHDATDD